MENHWLMIPGVFAQVLQESALLLQWDHNRANRVRDFHLIRSFCVSSRPEEIRPPPRKKKPEESVKPGERLLRTRLAGGKSASLGARPRRMRRSAR